MNFISTIPTSLKIEGAPEPSITSPLRIIMSYSDGELKFFITEEHSHLID